MKKAFILLALIGATTGAFSQSDNTSVAYVAYWSVGDSWDFRVSRALMDWDGDSLISNEVTEYFANFSIIDSTENSYTVAWTYPNELLSSWDLSRDMLYELSKYRQSRIVYTTTEHGEFVGIENWQELAGIIRSMTDDILSLYGKDPDADFDAKIEKAQSFLERYSTKEGIENLAQPELSLFHFPYGTIIQVKDTIRYEEKSDLPLGSKPMMLGVKIWFEDPGFRKPRSVLIKESEIKPGDSKEYLRALYNKMGYEPAKMQKALSESAFVLKTIIRYDFQTSPGVPVKINQSKILQIDLSTVKSHREETITLELLGSTRHR
ncbi:MAG: hypothetical protein QUS66_07710 [Bacteroidota bacterium]|nr:hypothetical protein [Bacteroidota bacterium]